MDPSPLVMANGVELQQVIVNLLRNAYEAVEQSAAEDRQVLVHGCVSFDSVQLTVELTSQKLR